MSDENEQQCVPGYAPGQEKDFVEALSIDELTVLGNIIIDRMKKETDTVNLTRCPVCNKPLKNWHQYKPTWTMIQIALEGIRVLSDGHKHFHIKADIHSAVSGHENHTITGRAVNNYSKMSKLGIIALCSEQGTIPEDGDVKSGRYACYTITKKGYDFVMGKKPLCPAVVRVKNDQVIDVPENRDTTVNVSDIRQYDEDSWLDATGRYSLVFPEDLTPGAQSAFGFAS
jgi:hypothetical protein